MAGGGNFIHRVISYVANELIVNGLANRVFANDDFRRLVLIAEMSAIFLLNFIVLFLLMMYLIPSPSPRFQRFAVRTSKKMEELSDIAAQKKKELAEQIKDASKNFESFKNQ